MAVMCPNNQVYREDLPTCGRTCIDASFAGNCDDERTMKGCGCEDGLFLNEDVS